MVLSAAKYVSKERLLLSRHVSCDAALLIELKHYVQHAVTNLLHRVSCLDVGRLILCDLIPVLVDHWEACHEVFRRGNVGVLLPNVQPESGVDYFGLDQLLVTRLGAAMHLHCALNQRTSEHAYLLALLNPLSSMLLHFDRNTDCSIGFKVRPICGFW